MVSNIQTFKLGNTKPPPEEHENKYLYQRLEFGGFLGALQMFCVQGLPDQLNSQMTCSVLIKALDELEDDSIDDVGAFEII